MAPYRRRRASSPYAGAAACATWGPAPGARAMTFVAVQRTRRRLGRLATTWSVPASGTSRRPIRPRPTWWRPPLGITYVAALCDRRPRLPVAMVAIAAGSIAVGVGGAIAGGLDA